MLTGTRMQRTIARDASVRGVGFIHGSDVAMRFRPADADTGIVFVRADLPERPKIPAHVHNVIPRQRRTTLQHGDASVEMVEHVLAALAGMRIDNCVIEIDAPETPGCDGSSQAFVDALSEAGTVELRRKRETFVIEKPITVRDGQATLTAHPGDGEGLVLAYHLDYGRHTSIGAQSLFIDVSPESFCEELAPSRTFLLENEAKALRDAGIGARTTESDLLIFGSEGVIGNSLRFPDECVRHKILDMVGDLSLLACDLKGHVVAHRSGHQLNATLVRALVEAVEDESTVCAGRIEERLDIESIMKILPHRYPFLLVDRVLEHEPKRRVLAIKNVTYNEPFFQGHFPARKIMPGVLIVEALAQAAGVLISDVINPAETLVMIISLDDVKIRKPVVPGDQLYLEVNSMRLKSSVAQMNCRATVDDQLVAEAQIKFVMVAAERAA